MRKPLYFRTRTLLVILAGLIFAGWFIPPFFHAKRYRRTLEAGLESKLGRPVKLGAVTFRLLPHPGFSVADVVVEEDPAFGTEPFARVDRIECDLRWRSLWGSRLDCARIVLDHPTLNLVRRPDGRWNVEDFLRQSSMGAKVHPVAAAKHSPPQPFTFEARDARVNFTLNSVKKPFILSGVQASLGFDPSQGAIRFNVAGTPLRTDLTLPSPGRVELSGEWTPGRDFKGPFRALLYTHNALLYGWAPLLTGRDPGLYGLVDANLQLQGSIRHANCTGHVHLEQLHRWESLPPSSSMPVDFSLAVSWDADRNRVAVHKLDANFADSRLHVSGVIDQVPSSPELDLVMAVERSHLQDLMELGSRITGHPAGFHASGRVDGLLTIQGPWRSRRYGGFIAVRSMALETRQAAFAVPEVDVKIDSKGAHILPVRFTAAPHVKCLAQGLLFPALPEGSGAGTPASLREHSRSASRLEGAARYELLFTLREAPLHDLIRRARTMGVRITQELDAEGTASATIRLSGKAWPFSKPHLGIDGDLDSARLLVPGLTEPVRLSRFHLQVDDKNILARPISAQIGASQFSGWISHHGSRDVPWSFEAQTPRLGMEQASLWFTVLGHRRPLRILDFIPGLRTLAARRAAGRNIFASVNARGSFDSREVTFRSLRLWDFHALVNLSDREARISDATFKVAGGTGTGTAEIDFNRSPADIAGKFKLAGLNLHRMAWRLPQAMRELRGSISAAGHFATRGLTRQEMSAHLQGEANLQFKKVSFGDFDPLQAAARAASLGALEPDRRDQTLPSAHLTLAIGNKQIALQPVSVALSGATLALDGTYGFSGIADLHLQVDLTHSRRHRINDPFEGAPLPQIAVLHLTGRLKNLAVTPRTESAQVQSQKP